MTIEFFDAFVTLGRLLLGGAFVFAGVRNVFNAGLLANIMTARGVPHAKLVLCLGIILQVAAGSLFALGLVVPVAAWALIAFLIVATFMFHNFWAHQGPERAARINGVIGNVALIGAFLSVTGTA